MNNKSNLPEWDALWLAESCGGVWEGGIPEILRGVGTDTRNFCERTLFIALKGERYDGHNYINQAFLKGASGCMVNADWKGDSASYLLRVGDTMSAMALFARAHRMRVAPVVVGITGSAGKSTVKQMVLHLLSGIAETSGTRGNWNNNVGLPLSLLAMTESSRFGVFEAGSNHPGEIALLAEIMQPDIALITNVGPVHIENFESVDKIAEEKADIFRALTPGGTAIVNVDDPFSDRLVSAAEARCIITIGEMRDDVDFSFSCLDSISGIFNLKVRDTGEEYRLNIGVPGKHQVLNAVYAAVVSLLCGSDWHTVTERLQSFLPMPMRWQLENLSGVTVVNDAYNANPVSMHAAVGTFFNIPCSGKRWLVLGDMLELGELSSEKHRELGEYLASMEWAGVIGVGAETAAMLEGARSGGLPSEILLHAADTAEAARMLASRVLPADAVLLKGSRGIALEKVLAALEGLL